MFPTSTSNLSPDAAAISQPQLRDMASEIRAEIPGAEVRLFGSRARGEARPDSDVDLLITAPDAWVVEHDRWAVLDRLRWRLSSPDWPVDLLLFSQSQARQRLHLSSSVVRHAYQEGVRLDA
jgi:predicted nucleotidyltransferase